MSDIKIDIEKQSVSCLYFLPKFIKNKLKRWNNIKNIERSIATESEWIISENNIIVNVLKIER